LEEIKWYQVINTAQKYPAYVGYFFGNSVYIKTINTNKNAQNVANMKRYHMDNCKKIREAVVG